MVDNVWKKMDTSKVYEALKSMTPEERLSELYLSHKELQNSIQQRLNAKVDRIKEEFWGFVNGKIVEEREEYNDLPFPTEAMLEDIKQVITSIYEDDEFYDILERYIRSVV